jgi:hypothetical protein
MDALRDELSKHETAVELDSLISTRIGFGREDFTDLRRLMNEHLAEAFDGGHFDEYSLDDLLAWGKQRVAERFAEHMEWQRSAVDTTTDLERLARAFRALDTSGIIAREAWDVHISEAVGNMYGERREHTQARGYVCCTDDLMWEGLGLRYGVFTEAGEQNPENQTAIGREVVAALTRQGLETEWSGDPRKLITVKGPHGGKPGFAGAQRRSGRNAVGPEADSGAKVTGEPVVEVEYHEEGGGFLGRHRSGHLVGDRAWREMLYRLTPNDGSFMIFRPPAGSLRLQMMWNVSEGSPVLWMEQPLASGTHVTPEQAEMAVEAMLAREECILGEFGELTAM